ncbi:unnamed protein product, partial [Rotaria sp. Silwood1]
TISLINNAIPLPPTVINLANEVTSNIHIEHIYIQFNQNESYRTTNSISSS